ncbi:MAG TPA: TldD/PmbA family protein [Candidatus Marinimicrobia bacterium]|nr:TldD/PmbA family protein [Candidatus Neomarinimicrobiota bacterium]
MEQMFTSLCDALFLELEKDELLTLSFGGENSQFIRFNNAAVRQTGLVDDGNIELKFIANERTCTGSFTVSGNPDTDIARGKGELARMRTEANEIPKDPFLVMPSNAGSSHEVQNANGLAFDDAVDALLPAMQGVDFVGIWANGRVFRGNANSLGQKHWFETESFCLDYSLVTPSHQMVKGTFSGSDWDQDEYENYLAQSKDKLKLMKRKPVKVSTGEYRTWFEPAAVADFLSMFSWNGISEASLQQGCSGFGKMRHDDTRLSPSFSIAEDFSSGLVPRFNSNGEISPDVLPLIQDGELRNTLVSSRTAAEYGAETNYAEGEEYLRSPRMNPGNLSQDKVLSSLDKGLYLSNVHYLNWSDNPGGRITGLTRYACFWVEHGEIQAPIKTMRFDDTFYRFFGDELEAVGAKTELIPEVQTYGGRNMGGIVCPGILASSFALTL